MRDQSEDGLVNPKGAFRMLRLLHHVTGAGDIGVRPWTGEGGYELERTRGGHSSP